MAREEGRGAARRGLYVRRSYDLESIEVREDGDARTITGHAAVFNKMSLDLGGFREKVSEGAFRKTLTEADVRALFNHSDDYVLGRLKARTLELSEDKRGLATKISPPDTTWARDLMTSMKRGDIDQMSFGFRVINDTWEIKDGQNVRTLDEVELFDVSVVTFPAYPQTDAQVRSLLQVAGLDFGMVAAAIVRAEQRLGLLPEDRALMKQAIAVLTRAHDAPDQPVHAPNAPAAGPQGRSIALLKTRIALAERA